MYSNSWGPIDLGDRVMGPRTLVKLALEEGTTKVRHHYVMLNLLQ